MANGSYWSGTLVKTGPDTWEVQYPKKRAPSQDPPKRCSQAGKAAARKAAQAEDAALPLHKKWYFKNGVVVNGTGAVVSTEVKVVKRAVVSGRKKIFIRFRYDNVIWVGYTLVTEPNRIKAQPSKGTELETNRMKKVKKVRCLGCGHPLAPGRSEYCSRCAEQRSKVRCKNPTCHAMVHSDPKKNKTGFCRVCVKQVNPYGVFVPPPPKHLRKGRSSHDAK